MSALGQKLPRPAPNLGVRFTPKSGHSAHFGVTCFGLSQGAYGDEYDETHLARLVGLGCRCDGCEHACRRSADAEAECGFLLADNVGHGDLGCYGGGELRGAPTPNIDQLAREGLRLTQFLVEPACIPSRAIYK